MQLHVHSLSPRGVTLATAGVGGEIRTLPLSLSISTVQPVSRDIWAAALIRAGEGEGAGMSQLQPETFTNCEADALDSSPMCQSDAASGRGGECASGCDRATGWSRAVAMAVMARSWQAAPTDPGGDRNAGWIRKAKIGHEIFSDQATGDGTEAFRSTTCRAEWRSARNPSVCSCSCA